MLQQRFPGGETVDRSTSGMTPRLRAGLIASAVIFGVAHGHFWAPGILVGLGFGWLAMRTGKLGEAVIAHACANAGVAAAE